MGCPLARPVLWIEADRLLNTHHRPIAVWFVSENRRHVPHISVIATLMCTEQQPLIAFTSCCVLDIFGSLNMVLGST